MTIIIPLTRGQVTLVSDEDADVADLKWYACFSPGYANSGKFIARRGAGKGSVVLLHRIILSRILERPLLRSEMVDHIHGNTLDNRRSELRLSTNAQNQANVGRRSDNTSGFKGVYWNKRDRRWRALIRINGKQILVGSYPTPEEAHAAYFRVAQAHYGEFANPGVVITPAFDYQSLFAAALTRAAHTPSATPFEEAA